MFDTDVKPHSVWIVENRSLPFSSYLSIRMQPNSHGMGWPEAYWSDQLADAIRISDQPSANILAWYLTGWAISEGAKIEVVEVPFNVVIWSQFPEVTR